MKPDKIKYMSKVAEEIIQYDFEEITPLLLNVFYHIMEKYGIKNGDRVENGIQSSTPEWVMCFDLFTSRVTSSLQMATLFEIPEELSCYKNEED